MSEPSLQARLEAIAAQVAPVFPLAAEALRSARQEVDALEREWSEAQREVLLARKHRCALPASIDEALNSGDGSYRP